MLPNVVGKVGVVGVVGVVETSLAALATITDAGVIGGSADSTQVCLHQTPN